jgi:hypothetical protein
MGNRDRRGREAKKPKKTKGQPAPAPAPAKSRYERTPEKPAPATPDTAAQS